MGLVTEVDDAAAPTVLIVDNNPMSSLRLSNLFKTRNFNVELCEDGDAHRGRHVDGVDGDRL